MQSSKPVYFMLVDDDPDDSFLFSSAIEEVAPDVHLVTADNGKNAMSHLESSADLPDVIFLDLNMPVMGGKECLSLLKSDERFSDIPVIMYTTSSQSKDIEETLYKGAICFITKPDKISELKNILTVISRDARKDLKQSLLRLSNTSTAYILC